MCGTEKGSVSRETLWAGIVPKRLCKAAGFGKSREDLAGTRWAQLHCTPSYKLSRVLDVVKGNSGTIFFFFSPWKESGLLESGVSAGLEVSSYLASARSTAQSGDRSTRQGLCRWPEMPMKTQARTLAAAVDTSGQVRGLFGRAVRTC